MATTHPPARLKTRYLEEIRPALIERFGYSSVMQAPEIQKITLNMGVGDAKQDSKVLEAAQQQLATIAGQQPSVRRARKSIAAFKLREGMPVGVAVTLRRERAYEFLDRLMSVAIPRIRDFRGLNPRSFDGHGNYSMGVREQIIFPEVDYDEIDQVRGLDITITTNAASDAEAFALLEAFGMPFAREGRPAGFGTPAEEAVADAAAQVAENAEARVAVDEIVAEAVAEVAEEAEAEAVVDEAVLAAAIDAAEEAQAEAVVDEAIADAADEAAAAEHDSTPPADTPAGGEATQEGQEG
jgi:large subunit ribosomal protein L5